VKLVETKLSGVGTLVSFTIVHIAIPELKHLAPYAVAIVQLKEGPFVLGILKGVRNPDEVFLGDSVAVDYEFSSSLTPGKCRLVFSSAKGIQ
jgi:uncharacterized OB-fold protein